MNEVRPRPRTDHRRRRPNPNGIGARPDRVALWAVFMAVAAMIAAAASAHASSGGIGGAPAGKTAEGGAGCDTTGRLGARALALGDCGADVQTLNWILNSRSFGTAVPLGEEFELTTAKSVKGFQRRAGIGADGVVDARTASALVGGMRRDRASWYGPGFYGNRTACGIELTTRTVGVAHRGLPCGTKVTIGYQGDFLRTTVIDRGPFRQGVKWDLTNAARKRLGLDQTAVVHSAIVR